MNYKGLVVFCLTLVLAGFIGLFTIFYYENSDLVPKEGGMVSDVRVGKPETFNPLFSNLNESDKDITYLVYSGLTKFDNSKNDFIPDLATYTIDRTAKNYTFTLEEGLKWHDGENLTADDVVFTYEILQDPRYTNSINRKAFENIFISKIDDRNIQFTLKDPYVFFPSLTTIGILPEHIWKDVPIERIASSDINLNPIGSGPFKPSKEFIVNPEKSITEVFLEKNNYYNHDIAIIDSLHLTFVPDLESLYGYTQKADALFIKDSDFRTNSVGFSSRDHTSVLEKLVAIYLNVQSSIFENSEVRKAFLYSLPSKEIDKLIDNDKQITSGIKNPVFKKIKDVKNRGDVKEFFISELDKVNENFVDDTKTNEYKITKPTELSVYSTNKSSISIEGTVPSDTEKILVNDYTLSKYTPGQENWSFIASTSFGTLKEGSNIYNIYFRKKDTEEKTLLDSITINYDPNLKEDKAENKNNTEKLLSTNDAGEYIWNGEKLVINLLIPDSSIKIREISDLIVRHFAEYGITINLVSADSSGFQSAIESNNYDLVIVGQSFDKTNDYFPYLHSSQIEGNGLNLNNISSFKLDTILTEMRDPTKALKSVSPITIANMLNEKNIELSEIVEDSNIVYPLYHPIIKYITRNDIDIQVPDDFNTHERFFFANKWHLNNKRELRTHSEISIYTQFWNWIDKNLFI